MQTIRAAVCHEFGQPLVIEDVVLRAPERGEVEVTLDAVAICHSDITYAEGHWGGTLPAVYGHEAAGRISALGDGVADFAVGDAVAVTLVFACGKCPSCGSGTPTQCQRPPDALDGTLRDGTGAPLVKAMACGAFAEKVVVDESQIVKLPDGIPMASASLLSCGVITGVGAVINAAQFRAGQDAVIIGAGGVGLNAIQGARIAGARRIVAVDMQPEKLEIAKEFGATDGVLASDPAPWDRAREIMGKGADAVFVTVGVIPVYDAAINYMDRGGKVVAVGMPPSDGESAYNPSNIAAYSQQILGSKMGDVVVKRDIPWMIDLYQQGRLKLDELVSGRWTLDQINEAIADTKSGAARRNVIIFD